MELFYHYLPWWFLASAVLWLARYRRGFALVLACTAVDCQAEVWRAPSHAMTLGNANVTYHAASDPETVVSGGFVWGYGSSSPPAYTGGHASFNFPAIGGPTAGTLAYYARTMTVAGTTLHRALNGATSRLHVTGDYGLEFAGSDRWFVVDGKVYGYTAMGTFTNGGGVLTVAVGPSTAASEIRCDDILICTPGEGFATEAEALASLPPPVPEAPETLFVWLSGGSGGTPLTLNMAAGEGLTASWHWDSEGALVLNTTVSDGQAYLWLQVASGNWGGDAVDVYWSLGEKRTVAEAVIVSAVGAAAASDAAQYVSDWITWTFSDPADATVVGIVANTADNYSVPSSHGGGATHPYGSAASDMWDYMHVEGFQWPSFPENPIDSNGNATTQEQFESSAGSAPLPGDECPCRASCRRGPSVTDPNADHGGSSGGEWCCGTSVQDPDGNPVGGASGTPCIGECDPIYCEGVTGCGYNVERSCCCPTESNCGTDAICECLAASRKVLEDIRDRIMDLTKVFTSGEAPYPGSIILDETEREISLQYEGMPENAVLGALSDPQILEVYPEPLSWQIPIPGAGGMMALPDITLTMNTGAWGWAGGDSIRLLIRSFVSMCLHVSVLSYIWRLLLGV